MTPTERGKLVRVLGMLGSAHDGERAAAGTAATRILATTGLSWDAIIGDRPSIQTRPANRDQRATALAVCRLHRASLTVWEASFVDDVRRQVSLTEKQFAKLLEIAADLPARRTM